MLPGRPQRRSSRHAETRLNLVIVALCVVQDGAIANQTASGMRAVWAPKAAAADALLAACYSATPLGGVALFSSVAGQLGSAGQANYGAANAALDAAADRLQAQVRIHLHNKLRYFQHKTLHGKLRLPTGSRRKRAFEHDSKTQTPCTVPQVRRCTVLQICCRLTCSSDSKWRGKTCTTKP